MPAYHHAGTRGDNPARRNAARCTRRRPRTRGRTLRRAIVLLVCALLAAHPPCCAAAAPTETRVAAPANPVAPRYEIVPPTRDGIGKRYLGRQVARVMSVEGAPWLERPEREREEQGSRLLAALALRPGMAVADIGAGTGWHSRRIARRVGGTGTVYAVDVQPEMLRQLRTRAAAEGIANIRTVQATATAANLAPRSIDVALMVDVYHELEFPFEVLRDIVRALRPGGVVVFVEYRAEDPQVPIKALHRMSLAQVKREAAAAGLRWRRTIDVLPWQHVVVFDAPPRA